MINVSIIVLSFLENESYFAICLRKVKGPESKLTNIEAYFKLKQSFLKQNQSPRKALLSPTSIGIMNAAAKTQVTTLNIKTE